MDTFWRDYGACIVIPICLAASYLLTRLAVGVFLSGRYHRGKPSRGLAEVLIFAIIFSLFYFLFLRLSGLI